MTWQRWIKYLLVIPFAYWVYLMAIKSWSYTSFHPEEGFLIAKRHLADNLWYLIPFYVHAFSSVFVLILGAAQFSTTLMNKAPRIHRVLGSVYLVLVLFISGPSGLLIAPYANGGLSPSVAFSLQGILWMLMTAMAWWHIRHGRIELHGKYMLRSFALAAGAVSLRIYAKVFLDWFGTHPIETYLTTSWLSWVGNLIFAEALIVLGFMSSFLTDSSDSTTT